MENTYSFRIKKTALHAAGTQVISWYDANTGDFPGKVELRKTPQGVVAFLDEKPIGVVQNNDGTPYTGGDFNFDGQKCVDDYTLTITGLTPGETNTMNAKVVKSVIEQKKTADVDLSAFESEIQRIADAEIQDGDVVRENINIMLQNQVSEKVIRAVLKQYQKWERPVCVPKTNYVAVNNDGYMQKALISALEGFATVFEGGQSVGKNVMAETIAKVMNMPYYLITFSADMTSDDIYGGKSTDNSASNHLNLDLAKRALAGDKDAAAEYDMYKAKASAIQIILDDSEFCNWLENGGVMCFNEMNLAEANLFGSFANQIADGTGFLFVPGRGRIYVNKKCVLLGTQNPGFEGTLTQNQATMSRFGVINFGYPKDIVGPLTAALKDIKDQIPKVVLNAVNKLYMETLKAVQSGEISDACLNIRGYARAIRNAVLWDDDLKSQIMIQVVNSCKEEDRAVLAQKVSLHFE